MFLDIFKKFLERDFEKFNKKKIYNKKTKKKTVFFFVYFFKIAFYRIFKIYQGTFPESLRSLAQKMKEEIDFK